jgi:DNA-3-methyladenine glycosylase I
MKVAQADALSLLNKYAEERTPVLFARASRNPMRDYKAIFDAIESTLFDVGSQKVPLEQIRAQLEPSKHLEGKRFTDDECYSMLVHVVFYSGFDAQKVSDRLPVIDENFPNYRVVADYKQGKIDSILNDPRMIRHEGKVTACVHNAKVFRDIIAKHSSLQAWIDTLPPLDSDKAIIESRERFRGLFQFLGERTAFHFMTDLGQPVLKPDRVIERIFRRFGLVPDDLKRDALYVALIREGQKFAKATGRPIRYIDIVFVTYGQDQTKDMGLERGICLEKKPSCSVCQAAKYCAYYARTHQVTA